MQLQAETDKDCQLEPSYSGAIFARLRSIIAVTIGESARWSSGAMICESPARL